MGAEERRKMSDIPFRDVDFPPVDLVIDRRPDGTITMVPREPLNIGVPSVPEGLARQAGRRPDKIAVAERPTPGAPWRTVTFAELKAQADGLAQWLIDQKIPDGRPVLIVSGNSIAHAVTRYAAMAAGVPVCPVSANYALLGKEGGFDRLRYVVEMVNPAVILAESAAYAPAVKAVAPEGVAVITREPNAFGESAFDFDQLVQTPVTDAVARSIEKIDPDATTAYMLTSGSTGRPKAVIHTQRMIIANLHQGWQTLGRAAGWDDVLLEWLPWSHVSGAFSSMAAGIFGGSFYIDGGKPLGPLFGETVRNLREIALPYFTNVPAGYAMLADALEDDAELRRTFFSKLRLMLYGGAGLPQALYDRIQDLAVAETGRRVFFTTGYGATETTSGSMSIYYMTEKVGIGLPMPGLTVKLVPDGDRYEIRMKGDMVTPGYLNQPELNAKILDEEGFYRIGDTVRFDDPNDPNKGLVFAGRLAEQFKLSTGTWVSGGALRAKVVQALSPVVADAIVCGENRDSVGILAWANPKGAEGVTGKAGFDPNDPALLAWVDERLAAHNREASGSSERIRRFAFLTEPPNAEAHEVSDKGTINQSMAKQRRAADIERLYADTPGAGVVQVGQISHGKVN